VTAKMQQKEAGKKTKLSLTNTQQLEILQ